MSAFPVSVVIPTRDRPAQAAAAVRSALAQTGVDVDVWVVDDGSVRPLELAAGLGRDPRVHLVRLARSCGPASARNTGVAASTGERVAFLDDDDRWRPGCLAHLAAALDGAGDDVAMVDGGFELWDGGRLVLRHLPDPRRDLPRRLLEHPSIVPSTVLVRRAALLAVGGFDPTLQRAEDWDLWLRLTDRYRVEAVPVVVADRARQPVDPAVMLRTYELFVARLEPRLRGLAAPERRRVEAAHLFDRGVLLAGLGRPAEARVALWRAWRQSPRRWRPLLHLGRTVVGEGAWTTGARLVRRFTGPG